MQVAPCYVCKAVAGQALYENVVGAIRICDRRDCNSHASTSNSSSIIQTRYDMTIPDIVKMKHEVKLENGAAAARNAGSPTLLVDLQPLTFKVYDDAHHYLATTLSAT